MTAVDGRNEGAALLIILIYVIMIFGVPLVYYAAFESSSLMATPGKMALGIIVCDMHGGRMSFWRALGRNIAKWISNITLYVGYFMAGFTQRRQALHDMICSCLVVKKGADVSALQPMPKTPVWRIILICLLGTGILPLIFGILAAIALPQYFKAVEKGRLTEALSIAESICVSQERYRITGNNTYTTNFDSLDTEFPGTRVDARTLEGTNFTFKLGNRAVVAERKTASGTPAAYTITRCYSTDKVCCSGSQDICTALGLTGELPANCCNR
jgi:Tfp pilus assembly protein PilE